MKRSILPAALAMLGALPIAAFSQTTELDPVIVTATRQPMRAYELLADTEVIDRDEIERSGATSLGDLVARQAGIQQVTSGGPGASSSVFIRGANSGHTLILVDGMRIDSATTGQPTLELIPLDLIERIEIVRGPASALYGSDAIGGVIQVFTKRGHGPAKPNAFIGFGNYDTVRADAGLAGSAGDLSYAAQVGHYRSDGFAATPTSTHADGFNQDYGNARLGLNLPGRGALTLSLLGSDGVNQYDGNLPLNTRADKKGQVATAAWRQPLGALWTSTLQAGTSVNDFATHDSGYDAVIRTRRDQVSWQSDLHLPLGTALLGAEIVTDHVVNTGANLVVDRRRTDSLIAGWTGQIDRHRLQLNLRRDDDDQYGRQNTGLLAYGYQLSTDWRGYASTASAFKAPAFNDLYWPLVCYGAYGCYGGNPALKPERARNREAGLAWERGEQRLKFVAFDNHIEDLIVWGNQPFNVGSARIRGGSAESNLAAGVWHASLALTVQHARDEDTGLPLIRRPDRQLNASVNRPLGAWTAGIEWKLVSAADDVHFSSGGRGSLGGYGLVGAYARRPLDAGWTLEVRGDNLGDKKYRQAIGFNTAGATIFVGLRYAP